jgi:hypothetical protein
VKHARTQYRNGAIAVCSGLFLFLCVVFSVHAQEMTESIDLAIEAIPNDPTPGATVVLEAKSFSLDLTQASIIWTYGGKTVLSGFGKTRLSVVAPGSGQIGTVTATVSATGTTPVTASLTLRPGSVDLLWEGADSTVPPFYKGRPLPAPGGLVRVVAIPASGAPAQANYQWSRNDSALPSASGAGNTSIVVRNDPLITQERISLGIAGGLFQGGGSVRITPRSPQTIAYQKKEGFIDYARGSTGSIAISGSGATLWFEPYFFSIATSIAADLSFETKLADAVIVGDPQNELRLSRPENGGTFPLAVSVRTNVYTTQNSSRQFSIFFN